MSMLLRLIVSIGIGAYLFSKLDISRSFEVIARTDPVSVAIGLSLLVGLMVPATFRWQRVLRCVDAHFPFFLLLRMNLAAGFASQALPTSLAGDALRAHWLRRSNMPTADAVLAVGIDRLLAFICLWILVLGALPFAFGVLDISSAQMFAAITKVLPAVFLIAGCSILTVGVCLWLKPMLLTRATRPVRRVVRQMARRPNLSGMIGYGIIVHCMRVLAVVVLARSMALDIALPLYFVIVPITLFLAMLPISIGGWGVREAVFAAVFVRAGTSLEEAIALSVAFGLAWLASTLPGFFAINSSLQGAMVSSGGINE